MDPATVEELGRRLFEAERLARPGPPVSAQFEDLSVADAYAIQEAYARLRTAGGTRRIGRKVGATSRSAQERFGIDSPDFGQLFEDMMLPNGAAVAADDLISPMVEPEIAFILGSDLRGPGVSADDVLAATRAVAPALEIIDTRIEDWRIQFVDTVADNGSSARCIVGDAFTPVDHLDLAAEKVSLHCNGQVVETAVGAAALGDPAAAVAWLANALADVERELHAGEVVLSGSLTPSCPASRGQRYEASFDRLGAVSCHFV